MFGVAAILTVLVAAVSACGSSGGSSSSSGSDTAASGSTASSGKDYKLVEVIPNVSDPYWNTVKCGATTEAAKLGASLKTFQTTSTETSALASAFNNAQLAKPDGLFLNVFQPTQFATEVKKMMSKGTPVITDEPLSPPTQYQNLALNGNGKNFLKTFFGLLPSGSGSIAVLGGIAGIPVIEEEYKPLLAAVKKQRPDIKVLPIQYDNFDITKSTSITSSLLLAHPDLKLIIAPAGPEGQGAAAAVKQAGKTGQVKIMAFDAVPAEVSALKDGTISVLIAKPAQQIGKEAVDKLIDELKSNPSGSAVQENVPTPKLDFKVITKDTVDDPATQGYLYKPSCSS